MQTLNIQNYFDKTEGIDRLNLELISAVKIFKQQNEIELAKYKQNAIGSLIGGIAQEIKSDLFSISASNELTNMLLKDKRTSITEEELNNLNNLYNNSKNTLSNIDMVLTSLIRNSTEISDYVMDGNEIYSIINLVLKNLVKEKLIDFNSNISLRPNSYIKGSVTDVMFLVCEIISKIIDQSKAQDIIDFSITEDEAHWLFEIESENISKLSSSFKYLIKMLMTSINESNIEIEDSKIVVSLNKI